VALSGRLGVIFDVDCGEGQRRIEGGWPIRGFDKGKKKGPENQEAWPGL
jgi:hypothetical protein